MKNLTAPELASLLADSQHEKPVLLDVRELWEIQLCQIAGSTHIPMNSIPDKLAELDKTKPIVCICHHGVRSRNVAAYLEKNGFTQMANLVGGVQAWADQVDRMMPTY